MGFASFASSPPKLHSWDGGKTWIDGGFGTYHLEAMHDFCRRHAPSSPTILETGAGNSTICFLHLGPKQLISIAPEQPLFDRIVAYCETNAISTEPLQMHVQGSEWALPRLASDAHHPKLDVALIDGCHNWPVVMIDFFYINSMLRKGGFLMLDDVSLHTVAELCRLLSFETKNFRLSADLGKMRIIEKLTDARELGEWITQPYITALSGYRTGPALNRIISAIISLRTFKQERLNWK